LSTCPTCQTRFEGEAVFCPLDGSPLVPSSADGEDALVGRVLGGRYRLVERLGQGGMGTVYRALHTLMDKPVAIKVLRAELSSDAEAVARFHREARSASRLDHDHCIRVTDFGQSDDGLLFLVMELLDGESLGTALRRGPFAPTRAAAIGLAVAEALAHAHEAGIIHRDLKPDNVFLARRSRGREIVKVLDFGLAKLASDSALGPSITRDGTVFGTPEYMAPEQAEGEKLDGRTDIYSLGVILYQMLTGDVPFRAASFVALLTKQVGERPVPPRERSPEADIPVELEAIVLACLAKRAADRFTGAQALADALEPFALEEPAHAMLLPTRRSEPSGLRHLPATDPLSSSAPRLSAVVETDSQLRGEVFSPPLGRRLAFGLGGLVLIGATAGIAWLTTRPKPPTVPVRADVIETPLGRAERLTAEGALEEAERLLANVRAEGDSVEVEEALSTVAEKRGNRLGALAHLHRATRLMPKNPEPRARLAALLLRLGQPGEACRQARFAMANRPEATTANQANAVLEHARCKEAP
jgi:serine/threonine-protein kinase